jgi:hypothetical protein
MGYFSRILNNCNETCIMALRSKEEKLSFRKRLEMKIHLSICKCCQNFTKQSDMMDDSLKTFFDDMKKQPTVKASDDLKARIKEQLK